MRIVESLTAIMDVSIVSPKNPFYRPVFCDWGETRRGLAGRIVGNFISLPVSLWEQENAAFQTPYEGVHLTKIDVNRRAPHLPPLMLV